MAKQRSAKAYVMLEQEQKVLTPEQELDNALNLQGKARKAALRAIYASSGKKKLRQLAV